MCPHCGSRRWDEPASKPKSATFELFSVPRRREGEHFLDWLVRVSEAIPPEVADRMPPDGSYNLDHYLYGSPKVD